MRLAKFGREVMLGERRLDPRHEVSAIRVVIHVLELAASAFRKMPARGLLMMRAKCECSVVQHGVAWHAKGNMAPA
jgi:hypothetical protein